MDQWSKGHLQFCSDPNNKILRGGGGGLPAARSPMRRGGRDHIIAEAKPKTRCKRVGSRLQVRHPPQPQPLTPLSFIGERLEGDLMSGQMRCLVVGKVGSVCPRGNSVPNPCSCFGPSDTPCANVWPRSSRTAPPPLGCCGARHPPSTVPRLTPQHLTTHIPPDVFPGRLCLAFIVTPPTPTTPKPSSRLEPQCLGYEGLAEGVCGGGGG